MNDSEKRQITTSNLIAKYIAAHARQKQQIEEMQEKIARLERLNNLFMWRINCAERTRSQ